MLEKGVISDELKKCSEFKEYRSSYRSIKKSQNITDTDDILALIRMVEERDPLSALMIADQKEDELATAYFEDFLIRRKEEIIENLQKEYLAGKEKREKDKEKERQTNNVLCHIAQIEIETFFLKANSVL